MGDRRIHPVRRRGPWAATLLLWLLLMWVLGSCATGGTLTPDRSGAEAAPTLTNTSARQASLTSTPTSPPHAAVTPTRTPKRKLTATTTVALSGLLTISYDRLPAQAWETIGLIQNGGPFPYRQDGAIFQNRERLLPAKPNGYYHEYTVVTAGSPDRGARRLVTGEKGELYYTDDHYDSFKQVVMP